jgi:hypothetical protein
MRKRILAPLLTVVLTATLGSASPAPEPPECVVAAAWVHAHADVLPTTLAEFSTFSMAHRRAIYSALPPNVRVSLWREHMERFLRPESPLNEAQRAALRGVIARVPELTLPDREPAEQQALIKQLATIFPRDLGVRLFVTLGDAPTSSRAGDSAPTCNCDPTAESSEFRTCFDGTACTMSYCNRTTMGCGFFWNSVCMRFCVPA